MTTTTTINKPELLERYLLRAITEIAEDLAKLEKRRALILKRLAKLRAGR